MNPDPWALSRDQLRYLIEHKYPWYPREVQYLFFYLNVCDHFFIAAKALGRLMSAFDTSGNCLIRYIKLSVALVCGVNAASLEVKPEKHVGLFKYADDGVHLLVRMLHSLYEHVESGIYKGLDMKRWRLSMEEANNGGNNHFIKNLDFKIRVHIIVAAKRGNGMRLEDVMECLSCCATCIEDEHKINTCMLPVVQVALHRFVFRTPNLILVSV